MKKLNNVVKKELLNIMTPLFEDGHDKEQANKVMAMYASKFPEDIQVIVNQIGQEYKEEVECFIYRIDDIDDSVTPWEKAHYVDGLIMVILNMFPTAKVFYMENRVKALNLFSSLSIEDKEFINELTYEISKDMYHSLVQMYKEV